MIVDYEDKILGTKAMYNHNPSIIKELENKKKIKKIIYVGRHGARFLTKAEKIDPIIKLFEKFDQRGKLTENGKVILGCLKLVSLTSQEKFGQLTNLGKEQLEGIATRLAQELIDFKYNSIKIANLADVFYFGSSGKDRGDSSLLIFIEEIYKALCKKGIIKSDKNVESLLTTYINKRPDIVYFHKFGDKSLKYQEYKNMKERENEVNYMINNEEYNKMQNKMLSFFMTDDESVKEIVKMKETIANDLFSILTILPGMFKESKAEEIKSSYKILENSFGRITLHNNKNNENSTFLDYIAYVNSWSAYIEKAMTYETKTIATPFLYFLKEEIMSAEKTSLNEKLEKDDIFLCHAEITIPLAAIFIELFKIDTNNMENIQELMATIGKMAGNLQWVIYDDNTIQIKLNELPLKRKYIRYLPKTNEDDTFITIKEFYNLLNAHIKDLE